MAYMDKVYNISQRFADTTKSSAGEDFIIHYTPANWCPTAVALDAEKAFRGLTEKEISEDPKKAVVLMLPTIAAVVIDWNLEYTEMVPPAEGVDVESDEWLTTPPQFVTKRLPHPLKIMMLKEDRREFFLMKLPPEIMQNFFVEAMKMESELPLEKLNSSVNSSDELKVTPPESPVSDQVRMLTPVPTMDEAAAAEAQLKELDAQLVATRSQSSPNGS